MTRYLSILLCALFLSFASCEDKEKSNKNITTTPPDTVATNNEEIEVADKEEDNETPPQQEEEKVGPLIVQEEFIPFMTKYGEENPETRVRIKTKFGDIDVQLYRNTPLHRANFIYLVKRGYFNGTFFHRVAKDFVIQGGNSDNRDTSKKRNYIGSYLIPSEFDAGHKHTRGAFSAAKYSHQNVSKASSPYEFFIVQSHRGAHHLDNDHTVFGRVTSGMNVVDEIAAQEVSEGEWPRRNIYIEVELLD